MSQEEFLAEIIDTRFLIMKRKGWQQSWTHPQMRCRTGKYSPGGSAVDWATGENHVKPSGRHREDVADCQQSALRLWL